MAKIDRQKVYDKCNGHCGYCGKEITIKQMQVDHIVAQWSTLSKEKSEKVGIIKGSDDFSNLMPTCTRCNKWKSTWNIEQFRREISLQVERLNKYSSAYRLAKDFDLVDENRNEVVFYYEVIEDLYGKIE
jgi:5-methylcytosine-specific restriction endonuclease McrA